MVRAVRFQADAVVVLALTHHVVLSNGFRLEWVLGSVVSILPQLHTDRVHAVGTLRRSEFPTDSGMVHTRMVSAKEFEARFHLISWTQLEENRMLFVGTKKESLH